MIKRNFNIVLKLFLVLCLFSLFYIHGHEKASNNDICLHYYGKNMITEKFSFSFEATMRYANGFSEKQQYLLRPSINYQFTEKLMGSFEFSS